MSKKVLIISSSPRKNGNSNLLCKQFANGAEETGHNIEIINLREKKVGFCIACDACRRKKSDCVFKDDSQEIIQKVFDCDVLVLATPVYFYNVSAQLKVLIDRFYAREHELWDLPKKDLYYIITNAAPTEEYQGSTEAVMDGFINCLRIFDKKAVIRGMGTMEAGSVLQKEVFEQAFICGKNI